MNTIIVCHSEHHGNTLKVAEVIASILGAKIVHSPDIDVKNVQEYELIGFGSGIYHGRFHQKLYNWVDTLPPQERKKAFLFSTTGSMTYSARAHKDFKSMLEKKGFKIVGEFSCPGFDTAISSEGINRGRPNIQDLKEAEGFAKGLNKN